MSVDPGLWLIVVVAAHVPLVWRRLLAYLRYFQQEGYEHLRFLKWTRARSLVDPAFVLAVAAAFLFRTSPLGSTFLFVAGAAALGAAQPDPRTSGKIPLRLTWRATRILAAAFVVSAGFWLALVASWRWGLASAFIASGAVFALLPLALSVANVCLVPYEKQVQGGYEADAARRVKACAPFTIGITGSYGKSSTKAILAHVLAFKGPTLAASGSINTLMGLTRHIRENLVRGHEFMVVEMGAFRTGSIRRLCQLTPPSAAIITAVGDMHLERFGSLDEIVKAKSELAAALPEGGVLVANADSPGAVRIARAATHCRTLLYGETSREALDTRVTSIAFSQQGTTFVLETRERAYPCFTPLFGRPIILNIAGAFTLAGAVGMDPEVIVSAIRTLRPVANRLEVVEDQGITWIRDAYNSNQTGFRAAIELAAALPATRRVLVTPGVIELGTSQFQVNRTLAAEAAAICDTTVVVGDTNRSAFEAGHRDTQRGGQLVSVPHRTEAFRWLRQTTVKGDVVILENDLPDLYERSAGIFWKARTPQPTPRAQAS